MPDRISLGEWRILVRRRNKTLAQLTFVPHPLNDDGDKEDFRRDWSQLSGDVILEVRDRLGYLDNLRLNHVCKSWLSTLHPKSASTSHCRWPWIFCAWDEASPRWRLVDLATKDSVVFEIPNHLPATVCIASRRGWLLFRSKSPHCRRYSYFLFDVVTATTRFLPCIEEDVGVGLGLVTYCPYSGALLVAHASCLPETGLSLRLASPGDAMWRVHRLRWGIRHDTVLHTLILRNHHQLCCFDRKGCVYVFDLMRKRWVYHLNFRDPCFLCAVESAGGEIVKVCMLPGARRPICPKCTLLFFKMDVSKENDLVWAEMKVSDLENREWFLGSNSGSFTTCGGKEKKVYQFRRYPLRWQWSEENGTEVCEYGMHVYAYDLVAEGRITQLLQMMHHPMQDLFPKIWELENKTSSLPQGMIANNLSQITWVDI